MPHQPKHLKLALMGLVPGLCRQCRPVGAPTGGAPTDFRPWPKQVAVMFSDLCPDTDQEFRPFTAKAGFNPNVLNAGICRFAFHLPLQFHHASIPAVLSFTPLPTTFCFLNFAFCFLPTAFYLLIPSCRRMRGRRSQESGRRCSQTWCSEPCYRSLSIRP
jgi:hypothetical protein